MVRSRRWCCMEFTRDVAARLARYSTSVLYLRSLRRPLLHSNPMGCAARDRGYGHQQAWPEPKTGDTATNKPGRAESTKNGRDTTRGQGRKGDSPSSGAAGEDHAARWASVAWAR